MAALSKLSREAGDLVRQLGLRTTNDIIDDMNREFQEAREENEARRRVSRQPRRSH